MTGTRYVFADFEDMVWVLTHLLLPGTIIPMTLPATGRTLLSKCGCLEREGRVVYVDASGGGLLQMLGVGDWKSLVAASVALVEKPLMVADLLDRTTDFYSVCLERVLSKVAVDYAAFYEPIAANTGPVISPTMFERFAMPGHRKVLGLLEKFNVPLHFLN